MHTVTRGLLLVAVLLLGIASCSAQQPESSNGVGRDVAVLTPDRGSAADRANDDLSSSRRNAITRAVEVASPAVVGINVTEIRSYSDPFESYFNDPFFERFFGRRRPRSYQQEVHGLGSGFIITRDGYVVTNDHVAGTASKIVVTMTDGKQYEARVIGSDVVSDVALLKIEADNLPFLKMADEDDAIVGEWVIALGNPFGLFDINSKPTVTVGVVSNTDVSLQPQENRVYRGMIQTDAAISSGNSGGPLLNALGEAIGMNTVIYSTSQSQAGAGSIGIGFAVPIGRVRRVVDEIRTKGGIDRNFWTGMQIQQVDARIARYLRLTTESGVVVVETVPSSPAHRAGIQVGDVIVAINGEAVRTEEDAVILLSDARVGDTMKITVIREGKQTVRELQLARRPER